jgi:transporter family protein
MFKHGFIFAILGALCWGIAPIFAKLGLAKVPPLIGLSVRTLIIAITVICILIVSGNIKGLAQLDAKTILFLAGEGFLGGLIGHFFYFKAMKLWEASKATPVVASYPLIAFILAVIFLGEKVTLAKSFGAILVVTGILLLGI